MPSNITVLVRQLFLPSSAGKRKRQEREGDISVDGEHDNGDGDNEVESTLLAHNNDNDERVEEVVEMPETTQANTSSRSPDHRRWCFRCTYKIRMVSDGRKEKPKTV